MAESYRVRLTKDYLVFSAAHFITFDKQICERLHGHNYRVTVWVDGPLDDNQYVVDFIALRDELHAIVLELDHHMLLPTLHPRIRVTFDDRQVDVAFEERRWSFPRGDCVLLPIANTTTELLARHIGHRLLDAIEQRTGVRPARLRVEVDECNGQAAQCDLVDE